MAGSHKLLWTGGWDSTFRLLWLTLIQQARVQPYYLVYPERRSTAAELRTIKKIRSLVGDRLGYQPVAPPIIGHQHELAPNSAITSALTRLRKLAVLGRQYDALARFADERDLDALETGIHQHDRASQFVTGQLGAPQDVRQVFGKLSFPLLEMSKLEMGTKAEESGFLDLLELSWFCHSSSNRACGVCPPCNATIEEGMGHRIPWQGHVQRAVFQLLRPLRKPADGPKHPQGHQAHP